MLEPSGRNQWQLVASLNYSENLSSAPMPFWLRMRPSFLLPEGGSALLQGQGLRHGDRVAALDCLP